LKRADKLYVSDQQLKIWLSAVKRDIESTFITFCASAEEILYSDLIPILTLQIGTLIKENLALEVRFEKSFPPQEHSHFLDRTLQQEQKLN